jgi:hypothetical protein
MQPIPQDSPRITSRSEGAITGGERMVFHQALCLIAQRVYRKCTALLKNHPNHKWIWGMLLALASYESYFVRAQLAALLFFTILYVILAALVALYILTIDAVYNGFLWAASIGRSFHPAMQHHAASPARVPGLSQRRQSVRDDKHNASSS